MRLLATATAEVWRPMVGFEGWYEVSDLGRIRRIRPARGARVGRILRQSTKKDTGYLQLTLHRESKAFGGTLVHLLVAAAFLGPNPGGYEVNHKDGVRTNAAVTNLEYVTPQGNQRHSWEQLGRQAVRGERIGAARLTAQAVREIRALRGKVTQRELGRRYGVSHSTIGSALRGKYWSHV